MSRADRDLERAVRIGGSDVLLSSESVGGTDRNARKRYVSGLHRSRDLAERRGRRRGRGRHRKCGGILLRGLLRYGRGLRRGKRGLCGKGFVEGEENEQRNRREDQEQRAHSPTIAGHVSPSRAIPV